MNGSVLVLQPTDLFKPTPLATRITGSSHNDCTKHLCLSAQAQACILMQDITVCLEITAVPPSKAFGSICAFEDSFRVICTSQDDFQVHMCIPGYVLGHTTWPEVLHLCLGHGFHCCDLHTDAGGFGNDNGSGKKKQRLEVAQHTYASD